MGIEKRYAYTPQTYRRIVFASTQSSYEDASKALNELAELEMLPKRVWRAAKRIGEERAEERKAAAAEYEKLPLPARNKSPVDPAPRMACVQMDGARFQRRDRTAAAADAGEEPDGHWREYKVGVLLSMTGETHAEDPCSELPATFADPGKMREIAREIKGFTHDAQVSHEAEEDIGGGSQKRAGQPEPLVRSVVATSGDVHAFGPMLAAEAYQRGFHAAERKAFVADGSATNWSVWSKYFSHYTPILDFVHALMYVYAAAMSGRAVDEGWTCYRDWAQWLWSGQTDRLIAAVEQRLNELGEPDKNESGTPRAQVAVSLGYLRNQRGRMRYDEYRRQGLPITSSAVESAIKQINRRVKGTEKFWSEGGDPMLHLVADRLSQTNATSKFWSRRLDRLIQASSYHQAG